MNENPSLWTLTLYLAMLSLIAVGGVNSALPDMHRMFVEQQAWLTDREFTALFALAQAAPGPNFLFATLVGWHIAGVGGALVATVAICGPSSCIAFALASAMRSWEDASLFRLIRRGLVPVTIGLVAASACLLTAAAATGWASYLVTAATAVFVLATRWNPLWALAAGGMLGIIGVV